MVEYVPTQVTDNFVSIIAEEFSLLLGDIKSNKRDICLISDVNPYGLIEDMAFIDDYAHQMEIVLINRTMILVRAYSDSKLNKIQNWCIFSDKPYELSIYLGEHINFINTQSINL